jgi:DNA-binding IclR family transcriptional regulator
MDSRTDRTRPTEELGARRDGPAPEGRDRQRGIDRAIALMEALLRQRAPMRIGELARLINAPRSTAYEIVKRLVEADILDVVSDDGRVYFGRAMHLFGRAYADANPFYRRARDVLERLAAETGATTQLCALRGNKYVVVESRDGPGLFRITVDIGADVPIPWTASGRLLLGHMTADEIRDFVPREDYRLPDGRVLAVDEFVKDVMRATAAGRCATTGLADRFTWCLAAPIRDRRNVTISTLCFVVPADTDEARREQLLDLLASAAEALSDHP